MTRRRLFTTLAALLALSCFCIAYVSWGTRDWSRENGTYGSPDMDAWLRLTIVTQLHDTGDWFNHKIDRYGVPDALETPWTRPLDVLLLAGSLPLSTLMPFKEALLTWAIWINPILLSVSLIMLSRIGWRLGLSTFSIAGAMLLFILSPFTLDTFAIGRTDHHSLLALTFLGWLCCLCNLGDRKSNTIAGMVLAFGIWVSPEFLVAGFLGLAWLGMRWLFQGERKNLHTLAEISGAACAAVALFLTLEYGISGWRVIAYDTISPAHVGMLAAGWAWSKGVWLSGEANLRQRILAVIATSVFCAAVLYAFPALLFGPASGADAMTWWHTRTYTPEAGPLHKLGITPLTMFLTSCVMAVAGVTAIYRFKERREYWMLIGMLAFFFSMLALYMLRWHAYAMPILVLCIAAGLEAWQRFMKRQLPNNVLANGTSTALMMILALLSGVVVARCMPQAKKADSANLTRQAACLKEAALIIRHNRFPGVEGSQVILALPFMLSTQIPFWTPHASALTWDYHRRGDALFGLSRFIYAWDGHVPYQLARQHRATLLLACDTNLIPFADPTMEGKDHEHPFLDNLLNGRRLPFWMTSLPRTPEQKDAGFYLFKISAYRFERDSLLSRHQGFVIMRGKSSFDSDRREQNWVQLPSFELENWKLLPSR